MIRVTRMDGTPVVLNADWIESVESVPETMIRLTTGTRMLVREPVEDVVRAFKHYKHETATRELEAQS